MSVQLTKQQLLPMLTAKKTAAVYSLQEIYFRSLLAHCIVLAAWPPNPTLQRVTSCSRNRLKRSPSAHPWNTEDPSPEAEGREREGE